jgi:uncharacterized protein YaaN involved in tellurite resistance
MIAVEQMKEAYTEYIQKLRGDIHVLQAKCRPQQRVINQKKEETKRALLKKHLPVSGSPFEYG